MMDRNTNSTHAQNSILIRNSFLAGALSASLLWMVSTKSWNIIKRVRSKLKEKKEDYSSIDTSTGTSTGESTGTGTGTETEPRYNPWKTPVAIQKIQLLELRKSLIEHGRRTSSASLLLLDKILKQESVVGELPKKRIPWPWESLRKNSSKDDNENSGGDNGIAGKNGTDDVVGDTPSSHNPSSHASSSHHDGKEEKKEICIGSIFGLDVGGTLSKLVYFEQKQETNSDNEDDADAGGGGRYGRHNSHETLMQTRSSETGHFNFHESCSEDDLQTITYPLHSPSASSDVFDKKLVRSHSLFNLSSKKAKREQALHRFYEFASRLDTYDTEVKDKSLSLHSRALGGEFHFMQFETRFLPQAMDLIRINDLHLNISKMGATGGGAHKYADEWDQILGIEIAKQDELDSLVAGMQFILSDVVGECYTFKPKGESKNDTPMNDENGSASDTKSETTGGASKVGVESEESESFNGAEAPSNDNGKTPQDLSRKVKVNFEPNKDSYPYLLVMIGTGVSVLRVDGPRKHERISGSTIGGGTYWGLCKLLTDVDDYESALNLAERGDHSKVDM